MPALIHDGPVRYTELEIRLRYVGDGRFSSTVESRQPSSYPDGHEHRLYVTAEDVRLALSATGALGRVAQIKDIGARLFSSLFESGLGSILERAREQSAREANGLQLRLVFDKHDAALAALPWEWMLDTWRGEFVASRGSDTITRTVAGAEISAREHRPAPARLLLVASDNQLPGVHTELDAIADAVARTPVQIQQLVNPTGRDLVAALRRFRPTVLHYCGNGFEDRDSQYIALGRDRISPDMLRSLLRDSFVPEIVTLNACTTGSFAFALAPMLRAIMALSSMISDRAAIELGYELYSGLARGLLLDTAVARARRALAVSTERDIGVPAWAAPVLYYSGQAPSLGSERPQPESRPAADPVPFVMLESRDERKRRLRVATLERNQRELVERIAAYGPGKVPADLEEQRKQVDALLANLKDGLER